MMKCPHCDSGTVYVYTPIVYRYDVKEIVENSQGKQYRMTLDAVKGAIKNAKLVSE